MIEVFDAKLDKRIKIEITLEEVLGICERYNVLNRTKVLL